MASTPRSWRRRDKFEAKRLSQMQREAVPVLTGGGAARIIRSGGRAAVQVDEKPRGQEGTTRRFEIHAIHDDYLECYPWYPEADGGSGILTETVMYVAKPVLLRGEITVVPPYEVGDVIVADWGIYGGTGVAVGAPLNAYCRWEDCNHDGRIAFSALYIDICNEPTPVYGCDDKYGAQYIFAADDWWEYETDDTNENAFPSMNPNVRYSGMEASTDLDIAIAVPYAAESPVGEFNIRDGALNGDILLSLDQDGKLTLAGHIDLFDLQDIRFLQGGIGWNFGEANEFYLANASGDKELVLDPGVQFRVDNIGETTGAHGVVIDNVLSAFAGFVGNDGAGDFDFRVEGDTLEYMLFLDASAATENIALLAAAAPNWQTMDRGLFIGDSTTAPTAAPASGVFVYAVAGDLHYYAPSQKTFVLDQPVYEDIRTSGLMVELRGVNDPTLTTFQGNLQLYAFADQAVAVNEEEVYFTIQFPHAYKEGTDVVAHIHWAPEDAAAGNVRWALEYEWLNIGDASSGSTTIIVDAATDTTALKHNLDNFPTIDGTGKTISSCLICRLYRNSSHANDTYTGKDAFLIDIDCHYQVDTMGSRQILVK